MSSTRAGEEPSSTLDAEAAEVGQAHLARWLDELLPPGPCLVWAGGTTLAAVLATDRRRSVLLVEPHAGEREEASRRSRPGVALGGPDAVGDGMTFDSGVIVADADGDAGVVERLVGGALRDAVVAVVADPADATWVVPALEAAGRRPTTVGQHLRLASVVVADDHPLPAGWLGLTEGEPDAVIVLDGADAHPSILIGRDAGPTPSWADLDWLRRSIREVDAELRAVDAVRLGHLEAQLTAAEQQRAELEARVASLQQRIAELEGSTSWRVTAPLRWVSDRTTRR
jgi:hypothetical protein